MVERHGQKEEPLHEKRYLTCTHVSPKNKTKKKGKLSRV